MVEEQAKPNPDFPTVKFPNPEEKGAMDLAIKTADAHSLSLIVATDPDADRLAVAEMVHHWHQFTGNQLGVLFASHILSTYPVSKDRSRLAMLCSAVSTGMLQVMAEVEGFHFQETLTGFKWLGNVALDLKNGGYDAVYAFEEAIGYMFSDVVHDKDGISAAAVFLAASARWQNEEDLTPWGKLQQLSKKYGYFEDANTYLISPDPETTNRVFADIRRQGIPLFVFPAAPQQSFVRLFACTARQNNYLPYSIKLLIRSTAGQMATRVSAFCPSIVTITNVGKS